MSALWTCPRGHGWRDDSPALAAPTCPVCGSPAQPVPPASPTDPAGPNQTVDFEPPPEAPPNAETLLTVAPLIEVGPSTHVSPEEVPAFETAGLAWKEPSRLGPTANLAKLLIPGYEVLGELGRGGMGVVYEARQLGLNRLVALKMVLTAEYASASELIRFRAEGEAVARLQHPHIVQIYEVGELDGRPFFSLEFVAGGSLAQKLNGKPQSPRPSAALVEMLAHAVQFAHDAGVIHRDLKPANVLLTEPHAPSGPSSHGSGSGRQVPEWMTQTVQQFGEPKITDFGLAKRLDSTAGQTQTGSILGTPSYMSPEQAAGKVHEVGPATDIYALGAILYEMLTGRPPFHAESPFDTLSQVVHDDPVPPAWLNPKLPRDLELICLKCLEKEPAKRYATAESLADDLARFLNGEPIAARAATHWEQARKWAKRRPTLTALLATATVLTVVLAVAGVHYQWKLRTALHETETQRDAATRANAEARRQLVRLTVSSGAELLDHGDLLGSLPWFAEALRLEQDDPTRAHVHRVRLAAVLKQAPRLLRAWFHDGSVNDVTFTPDGKYALTACAAGRTQFWPLRGNAPAHRIDTGAAVRRAILSGDGRHLVTFGTGSEARVWDAETGQAVGPPLTHGGPILDAAFSTDGHRIAIASADRTARVWAVAADRMAPRPFPHRDAVARVVFSPDGSAIATASADHSVRVWNLRTGKERFPALQPGGEVTGLVFRGDGRHLLTAGSDRAARFWDAETGVPVGPVLRQGHPLTLAVYSPDGHTVLTASTSGTAILWDAETGAPRGRPLVHGSEVLFATFSPDSRRVATMGDDNTARVSDSATGAPLSPPLRHAGTVFRAAFDASGRRLLTASQDGTARLWEIPTEPRSAAAAGSVSDRRDRLSPDGTRKLVIEADGVRVRESATGQPLTPVLAHKGAVLAAAFSPDGRRVATGSADRTARAWDAESGAAVAGPLRHGADVVDVAFSPDGRFVVTASADNTARVWDVVTGQAVTPPLRHGGTVLRAVFNPDGRYVLTSSQDGTARAWDAATGEPLTPALRPDGWVRKALAEPTAAANWELPADERSVEELIRLAEWLAGHRIGSIGGLVPLDMPALQTIGQELGRTEG